MGVKQIILQLFNGFGVSLCIFFFTLLIALPLGLLICFGSRSRFAPLKYFVKAFVWIIRGTPLMLQIIVVFYVPPLIGLNLDVLFNWMVAGSDNPTMWLRVIYTVIAFSINYACYFSEIYRGGIDSISKGQYEAARLLGMSRSKTFRKIILPQVCKRILPPMSNEVITLVKDTSLARIIAVSEIILVANGLVTNQGIVWPLFATGLFYLVFNGLLSILFAAVEKRISHFN